MTGSPILPYLWKSLGLALCPCFPKENSCWDLSDLCPLVPPALPLLLPFVPPSAHPSAMGATLEVSAPISGINSVLISSNLSSCHLLLVLLRINISKQ